jgi:hypothetical protein
MTKADKPTTRETYSTYRGRPIVLTIHASYVSVRLKGTRQRLTVDAAAIYSLACKQAAQAARAEKLAAKKARNTP